MPAGVTLRAGPYTPSGERLAHDCVNDNACRMEDADFPIDGSIIAFGSHRVYVAFVTGGYPAEVLTCDELPSTGNLHLSHNINDLCDRV
ncbi:hypothetical protein D1007_57523 [Hordeum vulgare]|nr:hypothetical protein D1007_57523 [Hordeum vulgare]